MLMIFTSIQQDKQLDFVANIYLKHWLPGLFLSQESILCSQKREQVLNETYKFDSWMCQSINVLNAYYYKNLRSVLNAYIFIAHNILNNTFSC